MNDGRRSLVVKQALPRLRVADDWIATPERALTEADALSFVAQLTPALVPEVIARDPERHAIVMQCAPSDWTDWKTILLGGTVEAAVARQLGETLADWHMGTSSGQRFPQRLESTKGFEQLRIDPYYRTVAAATPQACAIVDDMVARMRSRRLCLVHGDFSPKNVLVASSGRLWVIDFEVAHRGDPAFDLAFLLTHLTLKAMHRPELAADYDGCADEFIQHYVANVDQPLAPEWPYVLSHVGCLLLARVRGKSPAEYLTGPQRGQVWQLGLDLLDAAPGDPGELFSRRSKVLGVS